MTRGSVPSVLGVLALAAGLSWSGQSLAAGQSCASLKSATFKNTKIDSAEAIQPSPTWAFPPSMFNGLGGTDPAGAPNVQQPFCRVTATIETEIKFELWLPDNWNGKYQQVGNGGYSGALNYPTMGGALAKGYATASSDLGHASANAFEADWMVGHKQRIEDFGLRAHHLVSEVAKQIIGAHYAKAPARSYFVGCSSGGWQALTEIQNYPNDFDGVVAGAPAHNFVRLNLRGTVTSELGLAHPDGNLTPALTKLVADAALKKCDPEDGVTDGMMSNPLQCDFDAKQLQCKAGESSDACLNPAQVERVKALYGPFKSKGGMDLYPGPTLSAALAGGPPPGSADTPALPAPLANALKEFGYKGAPTVATFDADKEVPAMDKLMNPVMSAVNPDLSRFRARGGKVVAWHGWGDPAISPYNTLHYYDAVKAKTGGNMDDFYRIFFVPAMGHCGADATGPNKFDAVAALEGWVEKGLAPRALEASQYADGKFTRSRLLCKYPQVAKYDGKGSADDARSFTCAAP
ncbi:MAG TPA: tannase/feruloyl esterase family alpha/beta hydrolase [Gammaproteobacteria bacterium]|nr:tannase/feruloyl esterase family alpha/beta hydrolase [Gammaproteobacteria bacterium]